MRAAVVGVAGLTLGDAERRLFAATNPLGFILFRRNCQSREQVRALVRALRAAVGERNAPVLIDQEGGRVVRLRPPEWCHPPAARRIGELAERDRAAGVEAAWLNARLITVELADLGIDVVCAPVLDLLSGDGHDVVGDRAYGGDPELAGELGAAAVAGLLAGGVLPVIKHIPGHGRARVDSHHELPVVEAPADNLAAHDFRPFAACRAAPFAMTAHVVYRALDPTAPATLSPRVIGEAIRARIGFEGALLTDDLYMGALSGPLGERVRRALAAGCDAVLYGNGLAEPEVLLRETEELLQAVPTLEGAAALRVSDALGRRREPEPFDATAGALRLEALLNPGGGA